ncbi:MULTISPECIES: hypothetical protein [unclassified Bradyrhizobium]
MKTKVKFLTAIWGARYIEEFASISLPSYLAEGNLPFLASETALEIVILTSTDSRQKFDELPIFRKLSALCPVKYIFIDDLITSGNYGVTLTLAYARGIRDSGEAQTNTTFVFMNSDFVLANGSLRTLVKRLSEGHRSVMAPSLRACAETVLPTLSGMVDREHGTLTMAPRPLVRLAFDNLHPTVIGKTVTQSFLTCETHNQIYWQVNKDTLLARYHLIFMLAIRPEVPLGYVNSYCDYGFVPELVPSQDFCLLDDSDDFFMLELQSAAQERSMLSCGAGNPAKIAASLARWTTREHRRFAERDVVFHADDLPSPLTEIRQHAARLIEDLHRRMGSPVDHADHFYWVSGVAAWASLKFPEGGTKFPPEIEEKAGLSSPLVQAPATMSHSGPNVFDQVRSRLAGYLSSWRHSYLRLLSQINRKAGSIPNVPIWHHLWLDSQLIQRWAGHGHASTNRILLVSEEDSPLRHAMPKLVPIAVQMRFGELMPDNEDPVRSHHPGAASFEAVFMHVERKDLLKFRDLFETGLKFLKSGGSMVVFFEHKHSELDGSNFSAELAHRAEKLLPPAWLGCRLTAYFAGGSSKRLLRLAERRLFHYLVPSSLAELPHCLLAMMAWPALAIATAMNNFRLRNTFSQCPEYCTSALLVFSHVDAGPASTSSKELRGRRERAGVAEELYLSP